MLVTAQRHEPRHGADEAHPLDHPGVGRVGDDDLVAGVGEREQGIEHVVAVALRDDDLAIRVVRRAPSALDQPSHRFLHLVEPRKRQVGVGLVAADRGARHIHDVWMRRHIGIEILKPQNLRIRPRGRGHAVDAKPRNALQPSAHASDHPPQPPRAARGRRTTPCAVGQPAPGDLGRRSILVRV
jgi:hypothetical protein